MGDFSKIKFFEKKKIFETMQSKMGMKKISKILKILRGQNNLQKPAETEEKNNSSYECFRYGQFEDPRTNCKYLSTPPAYTLLARKRCSKKDVNVER